MAQRPGQAGLQSRRWRADTGIRSLSETAMQDISWGQAFSELSASIVDGLVRLWKQDFVQVGLAIGFFLALALPLLLVIALLWYVDASGWRPEGGFYKIGWAPGELLVSAKASVLGIGLCFDRRR